MEEPDTKERPDPQCGDCKGTGRITLFTSSRECDCVNRKPVGIDAIMTIQDSFKAIHIY